MKVYLILFFISTAIANSDLDWLGREKQKLSHLILAAKTCVPKDQRFCSGLSYGAKEWKKLKSLDTAACEREIKEAGFSIKYDDETYPEFIKSTMRAETLYRERVVLFKKTLVDRLDCLHELMHIHQQSPTLKGPLSPVQRARSEDNYIKRMNRVVAAIAQLEKQRKIASAKALAAQLEEHLAFVQVWKNLEVWFDEKEIHFMIYSHCKELGCNETDLDVAVSNLYRFRDYLPEKLKSRVEAEALLLIRKKETLAISEVKKNWQPLAPGDEFLSGLLRKDFPALVEFLKGEGLDVFMVSDQIPIPLLKDHSLFSAKVEGLRSVPPSALDGSKIAMNEALAKFNCGPPPEIILTINSTRGAIVHEYLHHLQSKKNPIYCVALASSPQLRADFEKGKISREEFEKRAIRNNILFAEAEYEVYSLLLPHRDKLSKFEALNNAELLKKYKERLRIH